MNFFEFKNIDSITDIKIVDKKVPIGKKDGIVCYKDRVSLKLSIDFSKDISWLDELDSNLTIEIGDTFYNKNGSEFKYDYLNKSSDYNTGSSAWDSLTEMVNDGEIYIMFNNGLTDEDC
jgi:hypothetical protein